jgi:chromosome partitioning protein
VCKKHNLKFESIFIPTRFTLQKKLSMEIKKYYHSKVPGVTEQGIRESLLGEEALALKVSLPEHAPSKPVADEMKSLLQEIHSRITVGIETKKRSAPWHSA